MSKICRWGNSLGVRLPSPIAKAAGLAHGTPVSVRLMDNGMILVVPASCVSVDPQAAPFQTVRQEQW